MHNLTSLLIRYRYLALFPIATLEGPVTAIAVGLLAHNGHLDFIPAYLVLILSDFLPDTFYYYVGRLGKEKQIIKKYGSKVKAIGTNFAILERLYKKHTIKTLILTKLAYGISVPFLISAGLSKVPYRKYISVAMSVTVIQYGLLMALGYNVSHAYSRLAGVVRFGGLAISIFLIIFVIAYFIFIRYIRREIIDLENE